MFAAHCRHHGTEVLLSERRIVSVRRTPTEHVVHFRCWCGTLGQFREPIAGCARGRSEPAWRVQICQERS